MGDDDDGDSQPIPQLTDELKDLAGGRGVQRGGGLVAYEDARFGCQGARDPDPLLLPPESCAG